MGDDQVPRAGEAMQLSGADELVQPKRELTMGGDTQVGQHLAIGGWSAIPGGKFLDRRQDALAEVTVWGRMPPGLVFTV